MKYSKEDSDYALSLIERLQSRDTNNIKLELENLVIYDLEMNVNQFLNELDFLDSIRERIPVMNLSGDKGYIPISLSSLGINLPFPMNNKRNKYNRRYWKEMHYLFRRLGMDEMYYNISDGGLGSNITGIDSEKARNTFTEKAIDFLANRIAAVQRFNDGDVENEWGKPTTLNLLQMSGGSQVTTPGCTFSVSTNSDGLRVFWSGAYYISQNYFSNPTSPVTSVLQAGTYIFGVDGGAYGNDIQWDTNAVVSLPGNPSVHLNY